MKKIFAASVALLICFHLSGVYCFFAMRLIQIRSEMEAHLAETSIDQLQRIEISFAEYKEAIVEENEIRIGDRMFDVAKIIVKKDSVVIFALQDEEEDGLLSVLEHLFKKSDHARKTPRTTGMVFFPIYLPSKFIFPARESKETKAFGFAQNLYHSFKPALNTPPPRTHASALFI